MARVQEALRLSPKDARAYVWLTIAGTAKLCVRHQRMPATSSRRCKVSIARGRHSLPGTLRYRLASALIMLASTANPSPPTNPSARQRRMNPPRDKRFANADAHPSLVIPRMEALGQFKGSSRIHPLPPTRLA